MFNPDAFLLLSEYFFCESILSGVVFAQAL